MNTGNIQRQMAQPQTQLQTQTVSDQAEQQEERQEEQQPITVSAHPEQGPVAVIENDENDEKQHVSPQEIKIQSPHQTEVVLPKELEDIGVEQSDEVERKLEKQMQEASVILGNEVTPAQAPAVASGLPMSYEEAVATQKNNQQARSPQNSFAWFITEIIRGWKKMSKT